MNNERRKKIKEARRKIDEAVAAIDSAKEDLDEAMGTLGEAKDEEQEYYDNMPESLQNGEKGEKAQLAIDELESAEGCVSETLETISEWDHTSVEGIDWDIILE